MDRLTPDQAAKVRDGVATSRRYLVCLVDRMDQSPIRNGDPKLYRLVRAAEDAMHSLSVELHYQSCVHGVGRPPTPDT